MTPDPTSSSKRVPRGGAKKTAKGKAVPPKAPESGSGSGQDGKDWVLRLFIAGQSPKSLLAYANLKKICEQNLAGHYRIEIVDLVKEPHLAQAHQIVAIPTLIRQLPEPMKRLIGDLSDHERALVGMDIRDC